MSRTLRKDEFWKHEELDIDELFSLIVPVEISKDLYTRGGLIEKGKQIFKSKIAAIRDSLCPKYRELTQRAENKYELAALIFTALANNPSLLDVPLVPLVTLIIKVGLDEICNE